MEESKQVNNIDNNIEMIVQKAVDTDEEKWKLIEKLNNYYAVSTLGRIMSMRDGRIMKLSTKKDGYKLLVAFVDGKRRGMHVHRLVADAFIPNPNNYPVVNHKDENPANNNVSNLEWCTWQYNNTYNNIQNRRKKSEKENIKFNTAYSKIHGALHRENNIYKNRKWQHVG